MKWSRGQQTRQLGEYRRGSIAGNAEALRAGSPGTESLGPSVLGVQGLASAEPAVVRLAVCRRRVQGMNLRSEVNTLPTLKPPPPSSSRMIDYPDNDLPARAVWFGRRQRTFLAPAYAKPASA